MSEGTVGVVDGVRVGLGNSGCTEGQRWTADLAIITAGVTPDGGTLGVGESLALSDGRDLLLVGAGDDGAAWVEVAVTPAS